MGKLIIPILTVFLVLATACTLFADVPDPLGMNNRAIGGGPLNEFTSGITDGIGLNNIGLLIKTWGTVTYVDPSEPFFYISDGSRPYDGSGFAGLRVSYGGLAPGNTFTPPNTGDKVVIVGISSTSAISLNEETKIIPTLRPRRQSDMTPLQP